MDNNPKFNMLDCLKSCIRAQAQHKHSTVFHFSFPFKEKPEIELNKSILVVSAPKILEDKFHNFFIKFG